MANRIKQAERMRIYNRAEELHARGYDHHSIVEMLISEFNISRDRATRAAGRAVRRARYRQMIGRQR